MTIRAAADLAPAVALEDAAGAIAKARRATLADRYAANSFTVEWRALAELEPVVAEWRELAAQALEPNVFYEPAFLLAAAPVFGRDAGAVLVWSGTDSHRLLGLFPARIVNRRYGLKLPVLLGLTHPYGPLGVPLVEREAAEPVIAAFFAHLAGAATLPGLVLLPFLPEDGPFAAALAPILRRAQMPVADFNRHQRALLAPGDERSLYVERAIGRHQQKELRRRWRRLAEIGAVLITAATEPAAVGRALDDFLALEAGGWKGRAGTATADHEQLRRFIAAAVCNLAAEGKAAINRIMVDGRAIAATIVLHSGRCAWFWKVAYDETFARYSPGVMLTVELTRDLLDDVKVTCADSCATANHAMIDHLWRERLQLCDRLIAARLLPPFALVRGLERLRATAIAQAKNIRGRFFS
jgi:CelD/BcsL family acetyltransferase involved in cellulose biosynthesis